MKITLIQSSLAWGKVDENLENFDRKVSACGGGDLILLPEMFASGCMMVKKSKEIAMAEKVAVAARYHDIRQMMLRWAASTTALVTGSTVYEENGHYYNRLIVAFPDGHCEYYDKRHCFRMGGENEHFTPGKRQLSVEFRGTKIAFFICYDLRFPVWCRNIEHYDVAVFVANWPASRREVWKTLLKARAIENQSFVAAVNCVGTDKNGLIYAGDSVILDARGELLASATEYGEESVTGVCEVADLHAFRKKFAVLEDKDEFNILM